MDSLSALKSVALIVVDCENNFYDQYLLYCKDMDLAPENIHGEDQSKHVYALSLIGLGLDFPKN